MKSFFFALITSVLIACQAEPKAVTDASAVGSQSQPSEPVAVKKPHVLEAHGQQRVDNYYWLRDDTRSDPEVLAYLEAENDWTDRELRDTRALQQTLCDEMVSRLTPEDASGLCVMETTGITSASNPTRISPSMRGEPAV